jgi:hypothetical protein
VKIKENVFEKKMKRKKKSVKAKESPQVGRGK